MNGYIPANDNRHELIIMGLVVSKAGYQTLQFKEDNLTQQDVNRMYSCLSKAFQKVKELETAIYSRLQ